VARRAIVEYLAKIGAEELESEELLSLLGEEFRKELQETPVEEYEKALEETRDGGMEEALYDTNVLIDTLKSGEKLKGYTTVLNIVEFPRGLELGLTVITPNSGRLPASNQDFTGDGEEGNPSSGG